MMPTFEEMFGPIMKILADEKSHHKEELKERMFAEFNMTPEEQNQTFQGGRNRLYGLISFACIELRGAGLLSIEKSNVTITAAGLNALKQKPDIDSKFVKSLPQYHRWIKEHNEFSLTRKDFASLTGGKNNIKYLKERAGALRGVIKKHLKGDLKGSTSYTAKPSDLSPVPGTKRKMRMWIGFVPDHALNKRVVESIQLRVTLTSDGISCHIHASWVAKARISSVQDMIAHDSGELIRALGDLPGNHTLRASAPGKDTVELTASSATHESLLAASGILGEKFAELDIGLTWGQTEALDMGNDIVANIVETFELLHPAYMLLNGADVQRPQPPRRADSTAFDKYKAMIYKKPQIIFYGPPGTGKTYVADRLASYLAGGDGTLVRHITFHQSYSYEEFVEGLKPDNEGGYKIEDGIFKRICADASGDPDRRYVLVIDEINRGRTEKIFGELITLIEGDKRGRRSAHLAYSKDEFTVPKNLVIIGTMNTADRSLTYLDAALRRRFVFFEVMPDYSVIQNTIHGVPLARLLAGLNSRIRMNEGREKQIGHSYLMYGGKPMTTIGELRLAFTYEIIPLVQDYFYEDYGKLNKILGDAFVDEKNMEITKDWGSDDEFAKALLQICDENNPP